MKKIFIKTYGCSFNQSDSENMGGLLTKSKKYEIVNSEDDADLVIINSCTVKNSAENKFLKDIRQIKKPKILAGCVPQADKDKSRFSKFSVVGTNQLNKIVEVVDETLLGNTVQLLKKDLNPRLNIPKIRKNNVIEIVPINEGCLGSCNFCATKFARGHLKSYETSEIIKHIRNALNDGIKEIWLTSQDTACYGYDINTNITQLLKKILEIKRDFKIRLGMGNPDYLPDYLDDLIEVFKDPRMFKFIHIPVQAGSNKVLKDMKREYSIETYKNIINKIIKIHPDITLATDIIVGYPTENKEDFKKTLELMKEIRPTVINISRFWPRPGTLAAKLKPLPTKEVKQRSIALRKLHQKISKENNAKWLNWVGDVLIDQKGKDDSFIGRNYAYLPVIVKEKCKLGDNLKVKIIEAKTYHLTGEIMK